jgi:uncharacterized protein DUF6922
LSELHKYLSEFNPVLFWDTKMKNINPEDHAAYIIERVVTRGNMKDWERLKAMYGLERIKNISTRLRSLDKKTLSFLSTYFNVRKEQFRCYSQKQ